MTHLVRIEVEGITATQVCTFFLKKNIRSCYFIFRLPKFLFIFSIINTNTNQWVFQTEFSNPISALKTFPSSCFRSIKNQCHHHKTSLMKVQLFCSQGRKEPQINTFVFCFLVFLAIFRSQKKCNQASKALDAAFGFKQVHTEKSRERELQPKRKGWGWKARDRNISVYLLKRSFGL